MATTLLEQTRGAGSTARSQAALHFTRSLKVCMYLRAPLWCHRILCAVRYMSAHTQLLVRQLHIWCLDVVFLRFLRSCKALICTVCYPPAGLQEDNERLVAAIVRDYQKDVKSHKEKLAQNHRVKKALDSLQLQSERLVSR